MTVELTHPLVGPLSLLDDTRLLPRSLESFARDPGSCLDYLQRVGNCVCACGIPTYAISAQFQFYTERLVNGLESFRVELFTNGLQHGPFWEITKLNVEWIIKWRSTKDRRMDIACDYLKVKPRFDVPSLDFQLSRLGHNIRSDIQQTSSKVPLKHFHPMLGLHDELLERLSQSTQTSDTLACDLTQTAFRLAEENELYSGLDKLHLGLSLPTYSGHRSMHRTKARTAGYLSRSAWLNMKQRSQMTEPDAGKHTVFIALGSNLGDRLNLLEKACSLMAKGGIKLVKTSGLYETKPMYMEDQGQFLNGVCEVGSCRVFHVSGS